MKKKYELNNQSDFENFINTADLVMVDFYAEWCPPCKLLLPILEELKDIRIGKVNTEENYEVATKYKISSLPTLVFFKNGKEIDRMIGLNTIEVLEHKIADLL